MFDALETCWYVWATVTAGSSCSYCGPTICAGRGDRAPWFVDNDRMMFVLRISPACLPVPYAVYRWKGITFQLEVTLSLFSILRVCLLKHVSESTSQVKNSDNTCVSFLLSLPSSVSPQVSFCPFRYFARTPTVLAFEHRRQRLLFTPFSLEPAQPWG